MTDQTTRPRGKLTVSASEAVNALLRYFGVTSRFAFENREVTPERAGDAAALLADLANNGLMAGLAGDDVRRCWPAAAELLGAARDLPAALAAARREGAETALRATDEYEVCERGDCLLPAPAGHDWKHCPDHCDDDDKEG
jgi:hypothetical protein